MKSYDNILLSNKNYRACRDYWIENLQGIDAGNFIEKISTVEIDKENKNDWENIQFNLHSDDVKVYLKICKDMDFALYIAFLSVLKCLLFKYSCRDDIYVAAPVYNEDGSEILINDYILIRSKLNGELTFKETLMKVKEIVLKGYENQRYPFEKVIEELDYIVGHSHGKLNDMIFACENIHNPSLLQNFKNSLVISFKKANDNISFNWSFDPTIYDTGEILRLVECFKRVCSQVAQNISNIKIHEIRLLSDEEKDKLIIRYNNTSAEYPSNKTVIQLFEEQVEISPGATALVFENLEMTYRELNNRANILARILRDNGIIQNQIVAVMCEHSFDLVTSILAVLKSGGAYLPIDPAYPDERINFMIGDSRASVLLANGKLSDKVKEPITIIDVEKIEYQEKDTSNLTCINKTDDLAYIIYTSGSTGSPKGAMIEHRGLTNYIWWAKKVYLCGDKLDFPLYSSISFDLTVTSIFTPLISGNRLVIYCDNHRELLIERILKDNKVGVVKLTPTHLELIKHMDLKHSCIKRLIVGGEDLKTYLAKEIFDAFVGQVEIYNEYGPTETVVGCMIHKYNYETDIKNSVPIGVPADNVQIYVLNKYKEPVYPGGVGEIYIAGDGVARGYLNRPELTTEKFIPCIFNENVRMYKTGDLVRWLPDNTLEYVGRIDQQVKIKGYRIELGEIEARLSTHQEIREVVVVDFKDCSNDIFLCAYYVSNKDLSVPELREYLLKTMPEYMVPAYFVRINEIPVTINGKIDRKQLPEPKVNIATGKKYIEPANPTEKRLALVWQEVLGVDRIGTHDDFFSLGGDSIKAIQISARARKCGLVLDTKDIFDYPTINQICSVVVDLNMQNAEIGEEKEMKLSPSQSEIFNNVGINNKSKYQSVVLRFENGYDKKLLEKAFDQLVRQHEIFKYSFIQKDDELLQVCKSEETFNIEINSLNYDSCVDTDECLRQQIDKLYQDSSLDNEELIKLRIVEFSDKGYLIIALHSLIIDGVSWSIILEDFSQIYSNMLNGKNYSFEYGTGSYRTWYEKLLALANDIELLEESMDYYKKIKEFSEHAHTEDVGIFKDRTAGRGIATMSLTPDVTSMLLENTNAAYNTEPTDLLVAALIKTLGRSTHNNKVILKFGDYPRKNIDDSLDISRTIGCFSPFCPVLFDNVNLDSVPEYIKTTKEIIRRIPMQGFGYGIIKHMKMSDDCIYNSDNEIIVNYYGHIDKYLDKKYFKVHTFDFNLLGLKDYGNNNMLEIDIIILDGKLRVSFNYNQYHYTVESIRDIIKQYESSLVEIINYCVEKKDSEITPSDLLYNELSFDELKEIISDIEDIEI